MRPRLPSFDRFPFGWAAVVGGVLGLILVRALPLDPHLNPDSWAFEAVARSLLAGRGFTYREPMLTGLDLYAFRAPGYSVFVACGMLLGGLGAVIAMQGALQGVTAALVGLIAGRLAGPRAAWIAFTLRFAWPAAWLHARLEGSELVFELLTVLAAWLAIESVERRSLGAGVLAGLATAASVHTRAVGLGTAVAITVWLCFRFPRVAVAFALAAVVAWAPWPARNAARLHAFVPFSTSGGATTWAGTMGGDVGPAYVWMSQHTNLGELRLDRQCYAFARQNVRANPAAAAKRSLRWALIYLGPIRGRDASMWVHRVAMLAALAALLMPAARRRLALPALVWAAQGGLMLTVAIIDRYRFPAEWCVVVAAAVGLVGLAERLGPRRAGWIAGLALVVCFAGSHLVARR
jgi:hypothetical protein